MPVQPFPWEELRSSSDPAIRRLAGDESADVLTSRRVQVLLEFPSGHPYRKWWGTHWRLVALADLGVRPGTAGLEPGIDRELSWLTATAHRRAVRWVRDLARTCASIEGNAVYSSSMLGFSGDPRVRTLVDSLLEWQWPDGGWNCDVNASGRRSSFHETVTPALGLAAYHHVTGDADARTAAMRSAELLLEHELFRSLRNHEIIHPSWTKLHYPPYWHYDVLQGLRLLDALNLLDDPRAAEALDVVDRSRDRSGRFSGASWTPPRDAVDWGRGGQNDMLNLRAATVLKAAGRSV